ncbi:hypothetical protein CA13_59510 [Planctomycetes bacterium CA13]|uniref:Uncharacterized protein n=1 Tax=Novipirellula herctigrandis TaxID=2527986 RepID=A0A5C5ZB03_9BACT|nr:hypothetical protein CA13_59510 [Planctomycetes bacterium CA13]
MFQESLFAFSITEWFRDGIHEIVHGFNHMNVTQWGILSACAVAFGFLCLKGHAIRR